MHPQTIRRLLGALLVAWSCGVLGQGGPTNPAGELDDAGVAASFALRIDGHATPTPLDIPGARRVTTTELQSALEADPGVRPVLLDVLGGNGHDTLPGAIWLPDAGRGESFDDALQARLGHALGLLSRGDPDRALVFLCAGPACWLSYNAALRAVRLGYRNVLWYRGGIAAWMAAGGVLARPTLVWKRGAAAPIP